jgi:hypothetical protein
VTVVSAWAPSLLFDSATLIDGVTAAFADDTNSAQNDSAATIMSLSEMVRAFRSHDDAE